MKNLENIKQYQEVIKEGKTILMFSASWCPDCRIIEPILPEIEERYGEFTFYHVDRDDFIELCQELDIYGIPSFIAFEDGKETGRFVSKDRKTKEEIEHFIDRVS